MRGQACCFETVAHKMVSKADKQQFRQNRLGLTWLLLGLARGQRRLGVAPGWLGGSRGRVMFPVAAWWCAGRLGRSWGRLGGS